MTRADLAGAMGVSPGRVSRILSGGEILTPRTLGAVLTALGARLEITLRPAHEHAPA
jgi:transcriptional regulator with XRE-family HTH domain